MDMYLILPFLIYLGIFDITLVDATEGLRIQRDVGYQMECCLCNDFDNDVNNDCTERRCYKDLVSSRRKLIVQCEYCQYTKIYNGGIWKMMGECSVGPLCEHDYSRTVATAGCFGTGTPSEDTTCYYCCRRPDVLSPNEYCINETMTGYTKFLKFNSGSQAPPLISSTAAVMSTTKPVIPVTTQKSTAATTLIQNGCSVCDSRDGTNCNDQVTACDTGKCQNRLTFDPTGKQTHIVKSCVPNILCTINSQTNDIVRCNPFFANRASPNGIVCTYCCDPKSSTSPCNTDAIIRVHSTAPPPPTSSTLTSVVTSSPTTTTQSTTQSTTPTTTPTTTPIQNGCSVCDSRNGTNCNDQVTACDTGKCQNRLTFDPAGKQTHIVKSCVPDILCTINTQTNDIVRCNPFFANRASPNGIVCTYCCDPKSSTSPCNTDAIIRTHSTARLRMVHPVAKKSPINRALSVKFQEECCICDDFDNDPSNDCSEQRCLADLYSSTRQLISQCEYCQFTQLYSGSRWKTKVQCSVQSLCQHDDARTEGTPGCFGQGTPEQDTTCSYCCRRPNALLPLDYCINNTFTGYTKFTKFPNVVTVHPLAVSSTAGKVTTASITAGCSVCIDEHGQNCNDQTISCDGKCQNRLIYDKTGSLIYVSKSCAIETECTQNIGSNDIVRCSAFMANKASSNGIICTYCCDPSISPCNTPLIPPNHPAPPVTTPLTSLPTTSLATSTYKLSTSTPSSSTTASTTRPTTQTTKTTTIPVTTSTSAAPSSTTPANFTNMCTICVGENGANCAEPVSMCEWKCQNRLVYNKDGTLLFVSKSCAVETECALNIGINDVIRCSPFMINKASPNGIVCTYCCDPKLPSATCNAGLTPRPGTQYVPTTPRTSSTPKTTIPVISTSTTTMKPLSQGTMLPNESTTMTMGIQSSKQTTVPTIVSSSTTASSSLSIVSSSQPTPSTTSSTQGPPMTSKTTTFAIPTLPKSTVSLSTNTPQTMTSKSSLTTNTMTTITTKAPFTTNTLSTGTPKSPFTTIIMSTRTPKTPFTTTTMSTGTPKSSFKTNTMSTDTPKTPFTTNTMSTDTPKTPFTTNTMSTDTPKAPFTTNTMSSLNTKSSFTTNTMSTDTPNASLTTNTVSTLNTKSSFTTNTMSTDTPKSQILTNVVSTGTPKSSLTTNTISTGSPKSSLTTYKMSTGTPKASFTTSTMTTDTPKSSITTNKMSTGPQKASFTTDTMSTGTPKSSLTTNTVSTGTAKSSLTTNTVSTGTAKPSLTTNTVPTETPKASFTTSTMSTDTPKAPLTTNKISTGTPKASFTTSTMSTGTPKSSLTTVSSFSTNTNEKMPTRPSTSSPKTASKETMSSNSILSITSTLKMAATTQQTVDTTEISMNENSTSSNSSEMTDNPFDMTTIDSTKYCAACINDQGSNCNDTIKECDGVCQTRLVYNNDGSLSVVSKGCAVEAECNLNVKVNDMARCNSTMTNKASPNGIICTYCCDPTSSSVPCNSNLVPSI